jgi:hypothetical protein
MGDLINFPLRNHNSLSAHQHTTSKAKIQFVRRGRKENSVETKVTSEIPSQIQPIINCTYIPTIELFNHLPLHDETTTIFFECHKSSVTSVALPSDIFRLRRSKAEKYFKRFDRNKGT